MSNWAYACCCADGSNCVECETVCDDFCSSSYVVDNINLTYTFSRYRQNVPACPPIGPACGQSCGFLEYDIEAIVTPDDPIVMNRVVCTANSKCGYYGEGYVNVQYTLNAIWTKRCDNCGGGSPITKTYAGSARVPVCLHVSCAECGTYECCQNTIYQETVWRHVLEICNFTVDCTADLPGQIDADPSSPFYGQCTPIDLSCDRPGCVDCDIAKSLRCAGASVSYQSPYECLDTVSLSEMCCLGWKRVAQCQDWCFEPAAWSTYGPFSAGFHDECDQGIPSVCDGVITGAYFPTWSSNAQVQAALTSYCGSASEEVPEPVGPQCGSTEFIQLGCNGQAWTYT